MEKFSECFRRKSICSNCRSTKRRDTTEERRSSWSSALRSLSVELQQFLLINDSYLSLFVLFIWNILKWKVRRANTLTRDTVSLSMYVQTHSAFSRKNEAHLKQCWMNAWWQVAHQKASNEQVNGTIVIGNSSRSHQAPVELILDSC